MRPAKPKRFRQFSLRFLLALVTLCALLIVPIAYRYRLSTNQPQAIVQVTLGSRDPRHDAAAADYFQQHNAGARRAHLDALVLAEPRIRELPSLQRASEPDRWLAHHLRISAFDANSRLAVTASGRTEQVNPLELATLVETAADLIRADATERNIPIAVYARYQVGE